MCIRDSIGSWVCRQLAEARRRVLILDRAPRLVSYLAGLEDFIAFEKVDITDFDNVGEILDRYKRGIEGIIHVAGLMGGPQFATDPRANIRLNTLGTVNMLEAARALDIGKFVYISSGAVYGQRDDIPRESDPMAPSDLYGAAKASAEFFGLQYANEFGLDFRAVRVYFAYGPGRRPSELYPLYQAVFGSLEGKTSVDMPKGADQEIDFTYLSDIARAILLVHDADKTKHRQYNAVSGSWHRLPELIEKVAEIAGVSVSIRLGPGRLMPRGPSLDTTRLREEFGFEPAYDIGKGVAEYLDWMKAVSYTHLTLPTKRIV